MEKSEPEVRVTFDMEPPAISAAAIAASKAMLEVWLNAAPGRSIKVVDKWDEDGNLKSYLEILEISDTYTCEECGAE